MTDNTTDLRGYLAGKGLEPDSPPFCYAAGFRDALLWCVSNCREPGGFQALLDATIRESLGAAGSREARPADTALKLAVRAAALLILHAGPSVADAIGADTTPGEPWIRDLDDLRVQHFDPRAN